MIIFLNGPFGVGKTSVARVARSCLPGTLVFDPEPIGVVLQRATAILSPYGNLVDDFQDLPLWRTLSVVGLRLARVTATHLIVPMTFSSVQYFKEIVDRTAQFEPRVHVSA